MRIGRSPGSGWSLDSPAGERAPEPDSGGTESGFELLFDAVEDRAMFLLDETGRVRTWNTGAERILGYPGDEIVGEHVSVLYRDEDVEAGVPGCDLREAAAEGYIRGEDWRVRADGSEFRADVTLAALRDGVDLVGYASVVRDLARGRRKQELLERTESLEHLVATISHDLRTPLAVAEGNVELAVETGDLSRLEATTRALERATELLDHLTKLAEDGRRITDPEPVDLREVATDAWLGVGTNEDGPTLDVEGTATVVADRRRLRELFENLFGNAVQHAGPDVSVRVGPLEREAGGFFVEDDGPGIPEGDRTEVFEMGYSTDPDGTGLGLAICERIADAHGWAIEATDGADGGARFEVSADGQE
jgi:PAS domain S-box-containing protein